MYHLTLSRQHADSLPRRRSSSSQTAFTRLHVNYSLLTDGSPHQNNLVVTQSTEVPCQPPKFAKTVFVLVRCRSYLLQRLSLNSCRLSADFLDGNIRTWISNDSHAMIYPLDNGKQLAFALTRRDGTNTASINWRDRKPITEVLDLLQGWDPALIRAISYFKSTLNWAIFNEPPADEWVSARGRIAFVGDAIHAMHPTSFQGGSQAIEDGATLAICLALAGGTAEGVPLGLEVYEAMRRPRTVEVQQMGHMVRSSLGSERACRVNVLTCYRPRPFATGSATTNLALLHHLPHRHPILSLTTLYQNVQPRCRSLRIRSIRTIRSISRYKLSSLICYVGEGND